MTSVLDFLYGIDVAVFRFCNVSIANPAFDAVFPFLTEIKHFYIPYALIFILIMVVGKRRGVTVVLLALLLIVISDQLSSTFIKSWVGRIRPCHVLDNVRLLVGCGGGKSFPSSHAVNNFAQAMLFSLFYPKARWYLFGFASLVAFSRLYVGVHYPSDVVAGALFGALLGWGLVMAFEKAFPKLAVVLPKHSPSHES